MKYYVMQKVFDAYGNPSYARYSMRGYTFNTAKRIAEQVAGYVCPLGSVSPCYVAESAS
jgi:hypothetical protein